jgi:CBS domain-containing protein
MAIVRDILSRKGRDVVTLTGAATVLDASQLMTERGIGAVLVVDDGALVGIFTERDVLRRVVAERRDPAATPLREVMTGSVLTCTPQTTFEECRAVMTDRRIRHLPVIGADGLCGIVSIGDVLAFQTDEQQATIQQLNSYVFDVR